MSQFAEKRFLPRSKVSQEDREHLKKIITECLSQASDIVFAYTHGSFVTSESFRDIDVGIFVIGEKDFYFESDISYELSAATGYEVEVRIINNAPVGFQTAVVLDGEVLFSRDEAVRTDFIEDAGRRYKEYAHFRNIFMEAFASDKQG